MTTKRAVDIPFGYRGLLDAMRQHYRKSVGARRTRDEVDPREDPDEIEIHNHYPNESDDEEPNMDEGEIVARYPAATHHCQTEGDEIVVYSGRPPKTKSDVNTTNSMTGDSRPPRPPRTLREMNTFFAGYYPRRKTTAAR